jgi:PHD/YefM family antitoxin component YafN of YafNO toxin-antitoxin module
MAKIAIQPVEPTVQITATEAKNRFGHCLTQSKIKPVRIEKNGRLEALLVSAEQFADLERRADAASPKMTAEEFGETYKEWIAEQNARVEKYGVFGQEFRTW